MTDPVDSRYVGGELELFAHARNWKRYWGTILQPCLRGDVLEVGAGLGANTRLLRSDQQRYWVCLEPDSRLLEQLRASHNCQSSTLNQVELRLGTLGSLNATELFDVILYIDVLEHIQHDVDELRRAATHLRNRGRVVVLSPAHQWLFSEFDAAIGHYRRYTRKSLKAVAETAGGLRLERMKYLDCCGLFASLANRLFLRQGVPSLRQILFWDRVLVPLARLFDPLLLHRFGKSILGIWVKAP